MWNELVRATAQPPFFTNWLRMSLSGELAPRLSRRFLSFFTDPWIPSPCAKFFQRADSLVLRGAAPIGTNTPLSTTHPLYVRDSPLLSSRAHREINTKLRENSLRKSPQVVVLLLKVEEISSGINDSFGLSSSAVTLKVVIVSAVATILSQPNP